MKVLVFGPSGTGKTYIPSKLRHLGVNTVDTDLIEGLSDWYLGKEKAQYPEDADEKFFENHEFLWDKEFLKDYLNRNPDIYLFGSAGNIFEMLDLFDKVYFLKAEPNLIKERLAHQSRENPMGRTEFQRENAVIWGQQLEQKAKELGIEFIDATLTPEEIFKLIKQT